MQGKYRLTGLLGQGGFGIVYDATDLRFNRRYAIKAIITSSATAQTQVLEEANILAGHARHFPFMPEIYDTWSERDRTFLVIEYVPGPTLADLLDDHGRWTAAQVEQFMRVTLADLVRFIICAANTNKPIQTSIARLNCSQTPIFRFCLPQCWRYVMVALTLPKT